VLATGVTRVICGSGGAGLAGCVPAAVLLLGLLLPVLSNDALLVLTVLTVLAALGAPVSRAFDFMNPVLGFQAGRTGASGSPLGGPVNSMQQSCKPSAT
jgi:hypothetical protein